MPSGSDVCIFQYVQENAVGEIRHIKWVQADLNSSEYGLEAGLCESSSL